MPGIADWFGGAKKEDVSAGADNAGADKAAAGADNRTEDNTRDNSDIPSIWEEQIAEDSKRRGNEDVSRTAGAEDKKLAADGFAEYIEGLNLMPQITEDAISEFQQGKPDKMQATFKQALGNVFQRVIFDMDKVVNARVEKAVAQATDIARTTVATDKFTDQLFQTLPWARSPNFAPIATSVAQRFLKMQGATPDKAIQATKRFFDKMRNELPETDGRRTAPGFPGRKGFGNDETGDDVDFRKVLLGLADDEAEG
jgi:hypothetical protein